VQKKEPRAAPTGATATTAGRSRDRAIIEALPDLLFLISREGRYLDFQCSLNHPLRVPRETLVGKTLRDVLPHDLADTWMRYVREALDEGREIIDEYQLNGMDFEGRIAVSGRDEVLAIVRDITGRKRRDRALAASEERLRLSLEAGRMGIWEWNTATGEVWWSDNLEELHGLPKGSFGGTLAAFLDLVHPDDRPVFEAAVGKAVSEGSEYSVEFRIVPPDGSIRWMRGQGRVFRTPDGAVGRMIGVGMEVTSLKRVEEELRALNSTLEARVEARTRELSERNAELESFVYTASHDLKAPLLSIQGMAELLAAAVNRSDAREAEFCLERVERNVGKMGRLLDDLLALSRIGRVDAEPSEVDLGAVLGQVLAELEGRIRAKGLQVESPEGAMMALYSASEAYQLLANLVGNAAKFAGRPGEEPRVRIAWHQEGSQICLVVEDNGPGIREEHREKAFGLFRKLDPQAEGTGVGLTIVRRIAERHGGSVTVGDSHLGGARFTVTMPAADRPPTP
jgi:PAS domain S-box-containing protein